MAAFLSHQNPHYIALKNLRSAVAQHKSPLNEILLEIGPLNKQLLDAPTPGCIAIDNPETISVLEAAYDKHNYNYWAIHLSKLPGFQGSPYDTTIDQLTLSYVEHFNGITKKLTWKDAPTTNGYDSIRFLQFFNFFQKWDHNTDFTALLKKGIEQHYLHKYPKTI